MAPAAPLLSPDTDREVVPDAVAPLADPFEAAAPAVVAPPAGRRTSPALNFFLAMSFVCLMCVFTTLDGLQKECTVHAYVCS